MITLGSRSFAGPFMAPLWSAPKGAGLYAVRSTQAQRAAVVRGLAREYRPEFTAIKET